VLIFLDNIQFINFFIVWRVKNTTKLRYQRQGCWVTIPVIGTLVRPSLINLNPNTPMLRQTFNQLPLRVFAQVNNIATTRVDTLEQYEEDNYGDVESRCSALPNTMYAKKSPNYIYSKKDKALHKVISQPKSSSTLIEKVNKT
jgi:hypothetical protein